MKVVLATIDLPGEMEQTLIGIGCTVQLVNTVDLVAYASNPSNLADLIVIDPPQWMENGELGVAHVMRVVEAMRRLPPAAAVWDGRKWSGIPIVVVERGAAPDPVLRDILSALDVTTVNSLNPEQLKRVLQSELSRYRKHLINQYTELGFHVDEKGGVFYVNGIAVTVRRGKESALYNGDADMRIGRMFIVQRDGTLLAREIDELQELINKPGLPEDELQMFVEKYPHFITNNLGRAIPHPKLPMGAGNEKDIPDFAIAPYALIPRDTDFEIIELKRADAKLIVQKRRGVRKFSEEIRFGIDQLRQVKRNMGDPMNERAVAQALGRAVKHPRLGLIVGRTPKDEDVAIIDEQQSYDMDVAITTWDQIVERQARQLPPHG